MEEIKMEKGFTKKQLERIGCSNEEIQLVLDYQKRLPVLVNNEDVEGFCVNTRQLHEQLGVKKKYSDWIKARIKSYRFTENVDFILISPLREIKKGRGGDVKSVDYMCTIDMAEDLAMVERTDIGETVRNYFKLMRDIVKRNVKWEEVRCYERTHYKPMCDALSNFIQRTTGRSGDGYDFALEANRLNVIATGNRAQSLKNYFGIQTNELTRDSLEKEYNEKISFLQDQNILLLGMNMPIQDRLKMLISMFDIQYPNAVDLIRGDRESLEQARKNLFL